MGSEDWWNGDNENDKTLLNIVWIAEKLGRLPTSEEVPNTHQWPYLSRCSIYFGSFENALEKVAELLYGNKVLTSPTDLLPEERELPEIEQKRILQERWRMYQETLQELRQPGALNRRRKKREAELRRERYNRSVDGYTVRNLPIRAYHDVMKDFDEKTQAQMARSTAGLVEPKKERFEKPLDGRKRRYPNFQEQWAASPYNPANRPKTSSQPHLTEEQARAKIAKAAADRRAQGRTVATNAKERITRYDAILALWLLYQEYGSLPTMMQINLHERVYKGVRIPTCQTIRRLLGERDTWEQQLRDYAGARGLSFERAAVESHGERRRESSTTLDSERLSAATSRFEAPVSESHATSRFEFPTGESHVAPRFEPSVELAEAPMEESQTSEHESDKMNSNQPEKLAEQVAEATKAQLAGQIGEREAEAVAELVAKPVAELLMQGLTTATITLEGGNDEMGGPRASKGNVLEALWRVKQGLGEMPSYRQLTELARTREYGQLPALATINKTLGPGKENWEQQVMVYAKEKGYLDAPADAPEAGAGEAPPLGSLDGSDESNAGGAPLAGGAALEGAADEPLPAEEPAPEGGGAPVGGNDQQSSGNAEEMGAGAPAGENDQQSAPPGAETASGDVEGTADQAGAEEDDTKVYHGLDGLELPNPPKVLTLDLNLQSVQLNFRLNGQDYVMRLRFGGRPE